MGGSSKKQTIGYKLRLGMHLVLCHSAEAITEIFFDKKSVWKGNAGDGAIQVEAPEVFGGEKREGGIVGKFSVMLGKATQMPNAYLSNFITRLPAFRGVVSVVLENVYLGMNPYLKPVSFRVSRKGTIGSDPLQKVLDSRVAIFIDKSQSMRATYGGGTRIEKARAAAMLMIDQMADAYDENPSLKFSLGLFAINHYVYPEQHPGRPASNSSINTTIENFTSAQRAAAKNWVQTYCKVDELTEPGVVDELATQLEFGSPVKWQYQFESSLLGLDHIGDFFPEYTPSNNVVVVFSDDMSGYYGFANPTPDRKMPIMWNSFGAGQDSPWCVKYSNPVKIQAVIVQPNEEWESSDNMAGSGLDAISNQTVAKTVRLSTSGKIAESASEFKKLLVGYVTNDGGSTAGTGSGDMNPAEIIRECLTEKDWGMGYPMAALDQVSFGAAYQALADEAFGISILWTKQTTIESFVTEICKHIDAVVYQDRFTSKFKLKLVRYDYDEANLLVLDPSNISMLQDFSRPTVGELANSVTVNFLDGATNTDASLTVQNLALYMQQGATINTTLQYPGITNRRLAAIVAQRDLRTLSTPLVACTIIASSVASGLNQGDVFILTWPDYDLYNVVMRVTGISYGTDRSRAVRITCTQDVFALPPVAIIETPGSEWQNPTSTPPDAVIRGVAFETPYFELVQRFGQLTVDQQLSASPEYSMLIATAEKPARATNMNVYVDDSLSADYIEVGTADFSPVAYLNAPIGYMDTELIVQLNAGYEPLIKIGEWIYVSGEYMSIVGYTSGVLTVKRGCLDTVPATHAIGTLLYFCDNYAYVQEKEYAQGETIAVAFSAANGAGSVAVDDSAKSTVKFVGRANRPYPPANVKINGEYYNAEKMGAINVTWAYRNRVQQTGSNILGFFDPSLSAPETGTTYTAQIRRIDTFELLYSVEDVTGSSVTIPATAVPAGFDAVTLKLSSFRDGLECATPFYATINVLQSTGGDMSFTMDDFTEPAGGGTIVFTLD